MNPIPIQSVLALDCGYERRSEHEQLPSSDFRLQVGRSRNGNEAVASEERCDSDRSVMLVPGHEETTCKHKLYRSGEASGDAIDSPWQIRIVEHGATSHPMDSSHEMSMHVCA